MFDYDKEVYFQYQKALLLETDPYPVIKNIFKAAFIHIENIPKTARFYDYLVRYPTRYSKEYQDDFSAIFKVR